MTFKTPAKHPSPWKRFSLCILLTALFGCHHPTNTPYPETWLKEPTLFIPLHQGIPTLDPSDWVGADGERIATQLQDPLFIESNETRNKIHPLAATEPPSLTYLDRNWQPVQASAPQLTYTIVDIHLQPGRRFAPHPAFSTTSQGQLRYLKPSSWPKHHLNSMRDLKDWQTREITADDYRYALIRLAHHHPHHAFAQRLRHDLLGFETLWQAMPHLHHDLRALRLPGAKAIGRYHLQLILKGYHPHFVHRLTQPYWAPIPWEVDAFYAMPQARQARWSMRTHPSSSGPFRIAYPYPNEPKTRLPNTIIMDRNPAYPTPQPSESEGMLANRLVWHYEANSSHRWHQFLHGYFDLMPLYTNEHVDATQVSANGSLVLAPDLDKLNITFISHTLPTLRYLGFNLEDPVVGDHNPKAQALRQAISIAIDMEAYIDRWLHGRGYLVQGPLPPSIPGAQEQGINPIVFAPQSDGTWQRRRLNDAQTLLAEAGYPEGINPQTHRPLHLKLTLIQTQQHEQDAWWQQSFARLGIALTIEHLPPDTFLQALQSGETQLFLSGWASDIPEPSAFLTLFTSQSRSFKQLGHNFSNYHRPSFDHWFQQFTHTRPPSQPPLRPILKQLQEDAPWVWGYAPVQLDCYQNWVSLPSSQTNLTHAIRALRLHPEQRWRALLDRNPTELWTLWPWWLLLGSLIGAGWQANRRFNRRPHTPPKMKVSPPPKEEK